MTWVWELREWVWSGLVRDGRLTVRWCESVRGWGERSWTSRYHVVFLREFWKAFETVVKCRGELELGFSGRGTAMGFPG